MAARGDSDATGPELAERRQRRAGGGARAEDDCALDRGMLLRGVSRRPVRGFPQRTDDAGDVGVETGQQRASGAVSRRS